MNKKTRSETPTFLLEKPLSVDPGQARHLRAHFEAARCLYNALLGEALIRLRSGTRPSRTCGTPTASRTMHCRPSQSKLSAPGWPSTLTW